MADSKYPGYEDKDRRAAYVGGLKNELALLEQDPEKNARRIGNVQDQIDVYSDEPKQRRRRETAATLDEPKA